MQNAPVERFDLPRKPTFVLLIVLVSIHAYGMLPDLFVKADYLDYNVFKDGLARWEGNEIYGKNSSHVKYLIGEASILAFHNPKAVPIMVSLGLIIVTFFFTVQLTHNRAAGIISVLVLSTSRLFGYFDATAAYDNSWTMFFVLSLYMIQKKWQLSPVFFILSILDKPLPILFLPALFYFIAKSEASHKKHLYVTFGILAAAFFVTSAYMEYVDAFQFNPQGLINGLHSWWWYLIADPYMVFAVPLMFVTLAALGKKLPRSDIMLVLLLNTALFGSILEGFAYNITNQPYRYIPLITFFAASCGLLFDWFNQKVGLAKTISKIN